MILAAKSQEYDIANTILNNTLEDFTKNNADAYDILFRFAKKYSDFLVNGRSVKEKITEAEVDPYELKMGIEIEYEHTADYEIAKRIALDHLSEIENYYTLLTRMESTAKKRKGI